jgi:hypothetical protein
MKNLLQIPAARQVKTLSLLTGGGCITEETQRYYQRYATEGNSHPSIFLVTAILGAFRFV